MVSQLNPVPNFIPSEVHIVDDLETLKVLADPLRLRIRELLDEPRTVKQIAAELDMPPTKLYYHINQLEKHDLIVLVDTRVVSGIIEKHYQVSAHHVRVAKHLLSPEGGGEVGASLALSPFFDSARDDLLQSVKEGVVEWDDEGERHKGLSLHTGTVYLNDDQAAQFYAEVEELFDRYSSLSDTQTTDRLAKDYRIFYALFPGHTKRD